MQIKLLPVMMDETENLKWGDVFTIGVDKSAKNWQMVEDKHFIAVPHNYESRMFRRGWKIRIRLEERKLNKKKI